MKLAEIGGVFIGRPKQLWPDRPPSAIARARAEGRLKLTKTGLVGDEQADLAVHGGPEKALLQYPAEHYGYWATHFADGPRPEAPGGVGENISTTGGTEAEFHLGDVIRVGGALIQVSHGRQPCWKLDAHVGRDDMAYAFRKTGRIGWYYRVLEEGEIGAGDALMLEERKLPDWPLDKLFAAFFDPKIDPALAATLAATPELAEPWRATFAKRA